ncbi:acyl-CoA dehydrogenase family protein [Pallidibacillus pasinlerensis]|uniref:Acyl-CoA/acyl-ACP dehydrogenase n=1 Tax=Pallidibacillus pasinlerensis TaxID=2703818 RepID=A0ABX0A5J5_9BACI|nr:acyl-CoA dehydrogenase family protein [Pallidibacillus pasinlerensis]NCU18724.1 acyl-CoA/acyl-ACP dehydrogenase [Pallidibacillus pasinlerensis]
MSEMRELMVELTEKILKENCSKELVDQAEEGIWQGKLWKLIEEAGIFTIGISEDSGGTGGDYADGFHVLRLVGKYAVPLPVSETLIGNWLLQEMGLQPETNPLTISIKKDEFINIQEKEQGFLVTGKLTKVPWGRFAKKVVTIGKKEDETYFILLPIEGASIEKSTNLAGEPQDTISFDQTVTELQMKFVNVEGLIEKVQDLQGLSKAAMMSGAMENILDMTVQYTREREQFGRPIHRQQAVQQYLAILAGETAASLTITNKAIEAFQENNDVYELASARVKTSSAAGKVAELSHQVHGAIGVTYEHRLHQLTRRLWAWREEAGNENDWAEKLAHKILNDDKSTLWEFLTRTGSKNPVG